MIGLNTFPAMRVRVKPIVVCMGAGLNYYLINSFYSAWFSELTSFQNLSNLLTTEPTVAQRRGDIAKQQHSSILCKNDQYRHL
jgi:hypothetical protein